MNKEFMNVAIEESSIAFNNGEIPVGAVIVFNNKIIAKSHNEKIKNNDITNHAEINVIKTAANVLDDWRLSECDLYVTLEPCDMCKEVIKQSRIRNVYYLIEKLDYKKTFNKTSFNKVNDSEYLNDIENYKEKLSTFFKNNCKR